MGIHGHAEATGNQPEDGEPGREQAPNHAWYFAIAIAAWAGVLLTVIAATGWLYILRSAGLLNFGPAVPGALPLEQLARADAQPLARLLAVWLPAGWIAARAVGAGTQLGRGVGALGIALVAFATLFVAGAVSDAVTISDSVGSHASAQLGRAGTWVGVALMLSAALLTPRAQAGSSAPSGN